MAPPPGRWGSTVKLPVHVRMFLEEIAAVDTFAAALSQQSVAFSRAEALRIAAMEWLKERQARQARGTPAPSASRAGRRASARGRGSCTSSLRLNTTGSQSTVARLKRPIREGHHGIAAALPPYGQLTRL
jgi:hypothetical protein